MSSPSVIEEIFLGALDMGTPEARAAFLDVACKNDPDLRRRVERLLEAHPRTGSFLEPPARPPGEETAAYVLPSEQAGTVIAGRYKLLESIGEGGMGSVWVAEQTQPVRRKVALKLIKPGMDSKSVLARFEAERQALALMDHPNIAKVLDGGVTDQGRPFFVMEYVKGVPLTAYCDAARLTVEDRLKLFIPVCQAVQHAHQKGIVHRDLKPSNVLVCLYDGKPVPKVIDFGLAKAIHQPLTEHTLFTGHGVMMGTPLYMSPEQAELNNLDVDTRTDIYSLGVILYELLTGTTPLEKQRFQEAAWHEMLRLIKEEDPPPPSTRLSSRTTSPSIAAQRGMEPVKLSRLLRGELDWIVMKALDKDRNRRYETANGFADDVQRYLAGEAVLAVPPSAGYRLRKFLRKNRTVVAATGLILLALLAGIAGTTWEMVQADTARQSAETAERREREERSKADAARHAVELSALSMQVDLDLAELKADENLGLLRLARTLKRLPVELRDLREFLVVSVLVGGQDHAPLLPPMAHDVDSAAVSPDELDVNSDVVWINSNHKSILTLNSEVARLWDTRTARLIAVLRKGNERVFNCGFSPDGKTVFTDDRESVARFWDVPSGRFRAETEPRPSRLVLPGIWAGQDKDTADAEQISGDRLLTRRIIGTEKDSALNISWEGPVELWDTRTGRFIARLDRPNCVVQRFKFLYGGRWVTTVDGRSSILIFSAEDGRLLTRLNLPSAETLQNVYASSADGRIAAVSFREGNAQVRIWDADGWRAQPVTTYISNYARRGDLLFFPGEVFAFETLPEGSSLLVYRQGQAEPLAEFSDSHLTIEGSLMTASDLVHLGNGRVIDTRNWQRLRPPAGRKYAPELARFAPDERFVHARIDNKDVLIDTRTEKQFAMQWNWYQGSDWGSVPGLGMVSASDLKTFADVRLIPPAARLDIHPDLLELWAQVAVRGEIGSDGAFVKWDETTWERKRQELAARPAPWPDYPFPGNVASDQLHWLREEYESASDSAKHRLAKRLLDRAEAAGDKVEAARWRAVLAPMSDVPPQPPSK